MPNKLSQFWQELKRRNVTRVLAVYIAAAFMILELINMISEPLGLPEGTLLVAFFISLAGLVIVAIVSWIYDVHPEDGMIKTEPAEKVKAKDVPTSSNSWRVASYISFVVIVALILVNVIPQTGKKEILDKSIAVLPFESLSDDPEKQYQADGVMDAILLHLSKVEELRVISRTSVDQYRETDKAINEICEELDVTYILEGSFRRYGDQARLIVQLIQSGREGHAWANQYDRDWADIFTVESEVAQRIAGELQAVITPEEKQLIEKVPTTNLNALDFYTQGNERMWEYFSKNEVQYLDKAEYLFNMALNHDSTYAEAYTGLAKVYLYKNYYKDYLSTDFLDSVQILSEIAIHYDKDLAEAHTLLGIYFGEMGDFQKSNEAFNRAISLNPNDWLAYRHKAYINSNIDPVAHLENCMNALVHIRGPELPNMLRTTGYAFFAAGYSDKGMEYFKHALQLDADSLKFLQAFASIEGLSGDYEKSIILHHKILSIDSTNIEALSLLAYDYSFVGQYERSVYFYELWENSRMDMDNPYYGGLQRMGYAYFKNGMETEAQDFFNRQMEYCYIEIKLDRKDAKHLWPYYNLAGLFAFKGDRDKAYENLRIFNKRGMMPRWMVTLIKDDPLFDSIRDEPEFQQIVRDVEAKFQAQHERVRQWLEENDLL